MRRKRARLWSAVLVLCIVALIGALLHYLSFMPRYNVQTIAVEGASRTSSGEIEERARSQIKSSSNALFSSSNIFLYGPSRIREALLAHFPTIKTVRVGRPSLFSTTVYVRVEEREPYALWCLSAEAGSPEPGCYDIDRDGFIFARAGISRTAAHVFTGGVAATSSTPIGSRFAPGHFEGLLAFLDLLSEEGFTPEGARVENSQDFIVQLKDSYYLKVSFGEDMRDLLQNLQLILSSDALKDAHEKIQYIDLRFGDRVYYKLKSDTKNSAL